MSNQTNQNKFEPKIVAFLCNWCTYKGADLAGTSRFQYPSNIRTIRVMCSGSVDPVYIIKALLDGADGVLVGGCHLGDCHYQSGNYKAKRKMDILKSVLQITGIEEDRIWLRWISASEGDIFRNTVIEMVDFLRKLGPNPLGKPWNMWKKIRGGWKPKTINTPRGEGI
jgi:F420-non-reducing hydrogenase iron-sulfur subunit